ncbi:ribonuclease H-like domain-containing protein [Tanacetum coccineum]
MKRVLRYLRGTTDLGLELFRSTTSQFIAYSDADWAGCLATRRSTSGYYVFLCDNLLTWSSKRQDTLSRSSAEAEYRGAANAVAETSWIRNLIRELHTLLFTATLVYCDNVSAVYMSANSVQHQRTKHIEIDIHFVRDKVAAGPVQLIQFHHPGQSGQSAILGHSGQLPEQKTLLPNTFHAMPLQDLIPGNWNMDTGASSHLNDSVTSLSDVLNKCIYPSVLVGDGYTIPVTNFGHSVLPTPHRPFHLNNVLITPNIVKNLIYVRQFVRDNNYIVMERPWRQTRYRTPKEGDDWYASRQGHQPVYLASPRLSLAHDTMAGAMTSHAVATSHHC